MKQYKKSLYKYFILLAMGGCTLLTGCNDFLTTIPESSYSAAGSYQSQSDFDYAIAAVYAAQQELYKTNDCWYRLMIARSDDTRNGAGYTFGVDSLPIRTISATCLPPGRSCGRSFPVAI